MRRVFIGLIAACVIAAIAFAAYQYGEANASASSAGALHAWPHPWFFPFPLFAIVIVALLLRGLFWRGGCRAGRWGRFGRDGVPPMFDEWHRRAHAADRRADLDASSSG